MALNFSANQFEQAFKPKILRNWEVPHFFNSKPHQRTGHTKIIANDRGHLLTKNNNKSQSSPWGNFVGTWQFPKRITRKTADELNGTYLHSKQKQTKDKDIIDNNTKIKNTHEEDTDCEEDVKGAKAGKDDYQAGPYVPGDLTEEKYRLPSHQDLVEKFRPNEETRQNEEQSSISQECDDMLRRSCSKCRAERTPSPILAAISNFHVAKKLHKENLEHDPLPDTVTHLKYRQLQLQQRDHDPGLALEEEEEEEEEEENIATGIGYKGYPGYGPTKCTKLKVYRPATCVGKGKTGDKRERPSSLSSFEKKWRFIRQRKVSPIELAICWDLTPECAEDEPRRTTHIDGSNGSLAPAVFSMVHSPNAPNNDGPKSDGLRNNGSQIFDKLPIDCLQQKDLMRTDRPKTSSPQQIAINKPSKKRSKSAIDINADVSDKYNLQNNRKLYQSTSNVVDQCANVCKRKLCVACNMKKVTLRAKPHTEYKMAFKAGVPQKCVSRSQCKHAKIDVPKQKDPYSPKNYAIRTLAPPFSLQKDKRQDYPEHWRLATVYQHSYKPIQSRKQSLLASVFK